MDIRTAINSAGDFFNVYKDQVEMPKKDLVEVLIIMAALIEQLNGQSTGQNKYLAICKSTDGFTEAVWSNVWRMLKNDLPTMH